jgi:hypothetical protein
MSKHTNRVLFVPRRASEFRDTPTVRAGSPPTTRSGYSSAKVRAWCFTDFPAEQEFASRIEQFQSGFEEENIKFLIFQRERCPQSTGQAGLSEKQHREHLQGYVVFNSAVRLAAAKRFLHSASIHLEPRRGSHEEAKNYCSKSESRVDGPWVFGDEPPGSGFRSDLLAIKRAIDEGNTETYIAENYFSDWVRYNRSFARYRILKSGNSDLIRTAPIVKVFVGPTGVGKTHLACSEALELAGGDNSKVYMLSPSAAGIIYWDGYDGHKFVVIDEFPFKGIDIYCMLRYTDRYRIQVNQRGSSCYLDASHIWITSNILPQNWFPDDTYHIPALLRRLNVVQMNTPAYAPVLDIPFLDPNIDDLIALLDD